MLSQKEVDSKASLIQDMLDEGMSMHAIAKSLNVNHTQVSRTVSRMGLEIYQAFDEGFAVKSENNIIEAYPNQSGEDVFDSILRDLFDEGVCYLPDVQTEDYSHIAELLKDTRMDLIGYITAAGLSRLKSDILKKCSTCSKFIKITSFGKRKDNALGLASACKKCCAENRDKEALYKNARIGIHRRRSLKLSLPTRWDIKVKEFALSEFNHKCSLTGSKILHEDHFIPLSIGHGGTIIGNMVPLLSVLNVSKKDNNPFEWFAANAERFNLGPASFEALVAKLAEQNGLTPEDFREYTYWCFANPRNLTQIKRDNARYGYRVTSVELWREANGVRAKQVIA